MRMRGYKERLCVGLLERREGKGGGQRMGCRSHRKERKLPTERFLTASFPLSLCQSHTNTHSIALRLHCW